MLKTELGETIIEYSDLNSSYYNQIFKHFLDVGRCRGKKREYFNDFFTMDIETSTVGRSTDSPFAFTYSIAIYIADMCILCRRWEEYIDIIDRLYVKLGLTRYNRVVCYVHNLPYEFQFMRNFMHISDVFATAPRKVVKCYAEGIEYRCSYKLTNMSLDRFTSSIPTVVHGKLSGEEFDYSKLRTPNTVLTPKELDYIYNDVAGLYEALEYTINNDRYTLAEIPMTSTGFVRNDLREVMQKNPANRANFLRTRLDLNLYGLLREARRGGNTHCNPLYSDMPLPDLMSMDMSSAYPAVMIQKKFPMTPFVKARRVTDLDFLAKTYACIIDITFIGIRVNTMDTIPYIPKAHCTQVVNVVGDNGRVLTAERISMVITDIDYNIIAETYHWQDVEVREVYCSQYDYLPMELRLSLLEQYQKKTTLKDADPYYYMKIKNKFNANFGCMLTDICQDTVKYIERSTKPFKLDRDKDYEKQLNDYYESQKSFLSYQHGIWVTAHCRNRLQRAINLLANDMVYCDTDSVKFFDTSDNRLIFDILNDEIKLDIQTCGLDCTVKYKGKSYTLGVWENDGEYESFKSMGAKKYCYTDKKHKKCIYHKDMDCVRDNFHITVAGLSKAKARDYLAFRGMRENTDPIDYFHEGTLIQPKDSGRTSALYNDWTDVREVNINGENILVGSNMVITDVTYQFTLTEDYEKLITNIREGVVW